MVKSRNRLEKKLKGYQRASRERFLLLKNKILTHEEFIVYELAIAVTDWDRDHDTYGTFDGTNQEIANLLGWKSDSTVSRHIQKLLKKGYLIKDSNGLLSPRDFEEWELRKSSQAKMQEGIAKTQVFSAEMQKFPAEKRDDYAYKNNYPLVSSKYRLGFSSFIDNYSSEDLIRDFEEAEKRGEV